jgi:hypothetical protein
MFFFAGSAALTKRFTTPFETGRLPPNSGDSMYPSALVSCAGDVTNASTSATEMSRWNMRLPFAAFPAAAAV